MRKFDESPVTFGPKEFLSKCSTNFGDINTFTFNRKSLILLPLQAWILEVDSPSGLLPDKGCRTNFASLQFQNFWEKLSV